MIVKRGAALSDAPAVPVSSLRSWSVALPLVGLLAAACSGVLVRVDHGLAVQVGLCAGAATSLVVGVHLLWVTRARPHPASARLIGVALLLWGTSLALVAGAVGEAGAGYPTTGDQVASVGAVLALLGLGVAARGRSLAVDLARVMLDGLLLGTSALLLVWRLLLSGTLFEAPVTDAVSLSGLSVIGLDVVALSLVSLLFLRDVDTELLVGAFGVLAVTVGDVLVLRGLGEPSDRWPWQLGPLSALAAAALALALLRFDSRTRPKSVSDRVDDRTDARLTVATTVASLMLLGTSNVSVLLQREALDRVTMVLTLVVVVVFSAREVVGGLVRRTMLRSLTALAYRDPLTSLGNRRSLALRHRTLTSTGRASLLSLDLDGFKEVNDQLGHARGDALLAAVADQVRRCLPPDVEAFRIGGDEFAVVVPGDDTRASVVAEQLLVAVRAASHDVPGASAIRVSASIGIAELSPDVLRGLVESGVALRAAKSAGRDRVERYDGPVAARHRRAQVVERRLTRAIAAGEVVAYFQPVVDLATRRVVGFEALARWEDAELGRVTPDEFIPVAERSGLISELGIAVAAHAVAAVAQLGAAHPELGPLRMAVNASVVQLRRPGFCDRLLRMCLLHGVDPQQMIVEVTESLFVDLDDPALRELSLLRSHAVNVAIDDFGSGYSSLAYLSRVPANILKLDRELVSRIVTDPRAGSIVASIATLARALPMDIVMEGIETADVHQAVIDAGGGFGQGWLYGAAVPLADVAALVHRINAAAASPLALR